MHIKPIEIRFDEADLLCKKNVLTFYSESKLIGEFTAHKISVYLFSELIQIFGQWHKSNDSGPRKGVINVQLSAEYMKKARHNEIKGSDLLVCNWENWFIYSKNKKEQGYEANTSYH
jgi:hypothetical protein